MTQGFLRVGGEEFGDDKSARDAAAAPHIEQFDLSSASVVVRKPCLFSNERRWPVFSCCVRRSVLLSLCSPPRLGSSCPPFAVESVRRMSLTLPAAALHRKKPPDPERSQHHCHGHWPPWMDEGGGMIVAKPNRRAPLAFPRSLSLSPSSQTGRNLGHKEGERLLGGQIASPEIDPA